MTSRLKKALVSGAIILATVVPGISQQKAASQKKIEPYQRYINFSKNDPLIQMPSIKKPFKLAPSEEKIVKRLDELAIRLANDFKDSSRWKQIINAYLDPRFKIERDIIRIYSHRRGGIKSYEKYREQYEIDDKIKKAEIFYTKHKENIDLVAEKYNFDKRQIVSTLGIETNFGNTLGEKHAFNALVGLFLSVRKKEFGYDEMKEYLIYCDLKKKGLYDYKSSIAGAIGYPQAISSNLNKFFKERDPMNMLDAFCFICELHLANGWNPRYNHLIPTEGSVNWKAIHGYNHSDFYVRARNEIAASRFLKNAIDNSKTLNSEN